MRGSLLRMGLTPAAAVAGLSVLALATALAATVEFKEPRTDAAPRVQAMGQVHSERLMVNTYVIDCGHRAVQRPVQYTLDCADPRIRLTDLEWTQWDKDGAKATGTYLRRTCTKPCAHIQYYSTPVAVTADHVHRKNGVAIYTSLTVTFAKSAATRPTSKDYDVRPKG